MAFLLIYRDGRPLDIPAFSGRVLLAEDGLDNQRLISAYLRPAGVAVTIVGNGRDAVEAALQSEFDLVLMDVQMPVMDGTTATRTLRDCGYGRAIVALTANVMKEDIQRYRETGSDDVLGKPVDRERFYEVVARHLNASAALRNEPEDPAFARELAEYAETFRRGLPEQIDSIRVALHAEQWPVLTTLVHTLRGTAGSFGFRRLTELASGIETELRAARTASAAALCDGLFNEAESALLLAH